MPIEFACPNCRKRLRVAEKHAGCKSKCPACTSPLLVPLESEYAAPPPPPPPPPPPAPEPADNPFAFDEAGPAAPAPYHVEAPTSRTAGPRDEESELEPRGAREDWRPIHTGLGILRLGTILFGAAYAIVLAVYALMFLLILAGVATTWSANFSRASFGVEASEAGALPLAAAYSRPVYTAYSSSNSNGGAAAVGLMILAFGGFLVILVLAWRILRLVGEVFLVIGPNLGSLRGPAIGLLATEAFSLCSCGGVFVVQLSYELASSIGWAPTIFLYLVELANFILFLVFLWQIGKACNNARFCQAVVNYSIWLGVSIGVMVIGVVGLFVMIFGLVATSAGSNSRAFLPVAGGFMLVVFGVMYLMYVLLLGNLFFRLMALYEDARRTVARRGAFARA